MRPSRPRGRWRAGLRLGAYLIAFGLILGLTLIAVGVLFALFLGILFGGGIVAVLVGVGFLWLLLKGGDEERVSC